MLLIKERIPLPPRNSPDAVKARKISEFTTRSFHAFSLSHQTASTDYGFLKRSTFYAFSGAIFFTSLGNFIPSLWLPSFAADLNLSTSDGTLLVAIMNGECTCDVPLFKRPTDFRTIFSSCVSTRSHSPRMALRPTPNKICRDLFVPWVRSCLFSALGLGDPD